MSKTIEIKPSQMKIMYRVYATVRRVEKTLLFTSEIYQSAEDFCWAFDGKYTELHIEKTWIKQ
jgi:hypothetical protein